jgi:hypothetical protein
MKPFRRELLNALFVLVVGSLISTAFEAFHVEFDLHLWAVIVFALAVAVSGYTIFTIHLRFMANIEDRDRATAEATRQREEEWLRRVGTPARLESNFIASAIEAARSLGGQDLTTLFYVGPEGGQGYQTGAGDVGRKEFYEMEIEFVRRGTIREYKRIICFDDEVLTNDHQLAAGILSVGRGPGTIDPMLAEHGRAMLTTKNCSLYLAPVVLRGIVSLYGSNKVSVSVESVDQVGGGRLALGGLYFCDPPNGEIIEHFRQLVRATERRMIAVRQIRFPEDAAAIPEASAAQ